MKKCPKCGAMEFYVTAHVAQEWVVDENEDFIRCSNDCAEIVYYPGDLDIWECVRCGYSDSGMEFNVRQLDRG